MNGYYSVFDPDGKKIADCGIERDAVNLMHSRNKYWDGHYFTFNPLPGDIIDVSDGKQLPTRDICLLYTSPSPRDVEESRMPSSA